MKGLNHLKDFIDVEDFQKLQDDIAKATQIGIITCDYKGKPITKHSNCADYCSAIREIKPYKELCEKCDSRGGLEAVRTGKPYMYRCHRGLVDFAVPIIIEGQYLGSVMAGQVLIDEPNLSKLENIIQCSDKTDDNEKLKALYKKIPVIPHERFEAMAQMMFHISNYIVGQAVLKRAQIELNEKNIKFMEYEKNKVELEKELKASELKALQSQVNPHFLFNVLNNIVSLALLEDAPKTRETVCNLSEMLRYTLKKVDQIVTLEEEIKYNKSYLNLQKVRFGDRLKFSFNIDEECKKIKIPSMILQPFIENSIVHGLEEKEQGGNISVVAYECDNKLKIIISDNGVGIPEDKIKDVKEFKISETENGGIGINNVKQRIKYYYGDNYVIDIKSSIGIGTEIKMCLPKHF